MKNKSELIYEGKAKKVFSHDDEDKVIIEFKDDATAFNALKKEKFEGKGKLNCLISARIFEILIKKNIIFKIVTIFQIEIHKSKLNIFKENFQNFINF